MAVIVAAMVAACGAASVYTEGPRFVKALTACLKRHGVPDPENIPRSVTEEAIPALMGARGLVVPAGVTRAQYKRALTECGAGFERVAPTAITSPGLQKAISEVVACIRRNEYSLPPPNFPGPGPVVNVEGIDLTSARWQATALGCSTNRQLRPAVLRKCMGKSLRGPAKGRAFETHSIELVHCIRVAEGKISTGS